MPWLHKYKYGLLIGSAMFVVITWLNSSWAWVKDSQYERCIPEYTYYAREFDKPEKSKLKRNSIYAFYSKDLAPIYEKDTQMIKFLRGMPGDHVKVTSEGVFINGDLISAGLHHAYKMNIPEKQFYGEKVLGNNEYWFMGSSDSSFDSRYWGAVTYEQIIAEVHPLF